MKTKVNVSDWNVVRIFKVFQSSFLLKAESKFSFGKWPNPSFTGCSALQYCTAGSKLITKMNMCGKEWNFSKKNNLSMNHKFSDVPTTYTLTETITTSKPIIHYYITLKISPQILWKQLSIRFLSFDTYLADEMINLFNFNLSESGLFENFNNLYLNQEK